MQRGAAVEDALRDEIASWLELTLELLGAGSGRVELEEPRRACVCVVVHREPPRDSGVAQVTPLLARDGRELGRLSIEGGSGRVEEGRLARVARQAAAIVERACLLDELRSRDRAKEDLVASLAHELRTPLAPMRTALDLVKGRPDDRERAARAHEILDAQLTDLVRLVDDLVDVSRLSRDAPTLEAVPVDLVDVVAGASERGRSIAAAAGQELVVDAPDGPVVVPGDLTRLVQIVVGLLEHAAKHAGEGAHVQLSLRVEDGWALLAVADDGPGVPADRLRRFLEPFALERTHLGVGLTLVEKLVAMHEGHLAIQGGPNGRGTSVVVRLPLEGERAPESRSRWRRALVVDDNADGASLLAELLGDHGVEVSTVFDGTSALAAVRAFAPDVVFLDIGLPDIDGNDVARRIRASELPTQPFLVAVTGWSRPNDRRRTTASGFDRHIVKPIDPVALRRVLSR